MSAVSGPWQPVDDRRCELGEGARWLSSGRFVFVDLLAGRLFSTSGEPGAGAHEELALDVPLGAVAEHGDGWIAAAGEGVVVLREGEPTWLARPAADAEVAMRMNDGVADACGRFWAGAMPYDGEPGTGFLLRVDPDGSVHRVLDGLTIPNGPAVTPDGSRLFLADTPTGWIRAYDVDLITGDLGPAHDFAHVEDGGPDGMVVDADGCAWSAIWGAAQLRRFGPDGVLREVIEVPVQQPTSIALSASGPGRILVTSATHGLDDPGDFDGCTITATTDVRGIAAASFG